MMTQWFYLSSAQKFHGLSSDTKPTNCRNGSIFIEIDTALLYIFDERNKSWVVVPDSSGGGGSGTDNYNSLTNKPSINGVQLVGNKTLADLGLVDPMILKGVVSSVDNLPSAAQAGWTCLVGQASSPTLAVYMYTQNDGWKCAGGSEVVVDSALSTTSVNPVQNSVITNELNLKPGKKVEGTEYVIGDQTVIAQAGSEIFNIGTVEIEGQTFENNNIATGSGSHAEGLMTQAIGDASHAEGGRTVASHYFSHAEGIRTSAMGSSSHAEGTGTVASGDGSHSEGSETTASGDGSHAEGSETRASGDDSHAEGTRTVASGVRSHAEGYETYASGDESHAEGVGSTASGYCSHSEGDFTSASGDMSHAEGWGALASSDYQHVQGKFNIEDANGKYAFIIGNGTNDNNRSNAFAIDWDGKIYVNGSETGVDVSQISGSDSVEGEPPITVHMNKSQVIESWIIFGKTEQNGTPSVSNPVDVLGVGDVGEDLAPYATFTNSQTDTRTFLQPMLQIFGNGAYYEEVINVTEQGRYSITVRPEGDYSYIRFKHNGQTNDINFFTVEHTGGAGDVFTVSFYVEAFNPTVAGGIILKDIQLEPRSTPTPFGKYKIPVTINGQTVATIGIDKPLFDGDSMSYPENIVTRVNGVIESYNGETVGNDWVSSTGELSTGAYVVYKLSVPTTSSIDLPEITLVNGDNIISTDTDVLPKSMFLEWEGAARDSTSFAYIAPNGNDITNDGLSAQSPFATINHALELGCTRILLAGGRYEQTINLGLAKGKHVQIESIDRTSRPVFVDPSCVLVESATLDSGVYHATIEGTISSGNDWIYQDGVADLLTTISDAERLPLQRGKPTRCDDTCIMRCSSNTLADALQEIAGAATNVYKWYLDGSTLYFSSPVAPSAQNPICYSAGNELFLNADRSISLTANGIACKYIALNVKNMCDVSLADCKASNIYGYGAITYDNTLNVKFLRCEASKCANSANGDGFNGDVTNTGEAFAKHYTITLIDCWAHDNNDDGYSAHRHAESTIIGGLFEYNCKSGITPAYGEHCSCYSVYSRQNFSGFMCCGEAEQAEGGKYTQLVCNSCIADKNTRGGYNAGYVVIDSGNRMELIGCKSIGNTAAYYVGSTSTARLIDCSESDYSVRINGDGHGAASRVEIVSAHAGERVTGQQFTDPVPVVAPEGAEIFNDYTNNVAIGIMSHAEGSDTHAHGSYSHTEGHSTVAEGSGAHAEGTGTRAMSDNQHAQGKFNSSASKYAFMIGNGTDDNNRHNALAVDWDGKIYVNGAANGVDVSEVEAAVESTQAEVDVLANLGAKNLLKITASSQTIRGVTFTVNDDQTVTVNGTNDGTGASTFVIVPNAQAITIPDGNYILSGCPADGGGSAASAPFDLRWYMYSPGKSAYDSGNGASIEKSGNGTDSNIAIVVKTGQTADNITFRPMLRRAEITDDTYVPYAPTNRELYELCGTKASLNDIYGLKNQLPNGTDLNNLSAGIMMCPGATVAATLINCPTTTDAFIIYTDYLATTSRAIQRIYSFSTTTGIPAQYMRVRWSQGWTPWYQVMMQSVASAQSAASLMQAGRLDAELTDAQEVTDDLDTNAEEMTDDI